MPPTPLCPAHRAPARARWTRVLVLLTLLSAACSDDVNDEMNDAAVIDADAATDGADTDAATDDASADPDADASADPDADASADPDADAATDADASVDADADAEDAADVADVLDARGYCERTAGMFCDYYLRCGRMAVDSLEACLEAFDEVCNAVYEPFYAALADAGRLELSAAGIATCADHLAGVACEQQLFDLDGPCGGVWRGLEPEGGACGPGVDHFVCAPGTVCVLGLSFCGTCEAAAAIGEACSVDGPRCPREGRCVEGVCVQRALPGEACDPETKPCVVGASCASGVCEGFEVVGVGEVCDQGRRCPYKSACVGGVCVESALLGELCAGATGCASGACDDADRCVPRLGAGEACGASDQCTSGVCDAGACASIEATFCPGG